METIEMSDALWDIFSNDATLIDLLDADATSENSMAIKFRQVNVAAEEYQSENLPFIAWYFADADTTSNDYMNLGYLRIDIYCSLFSEVKAIRKRLVELMHSNFDERIRAEGQYSSGITNVYKYRLEFTPLIFT